MEDYISKLQGNIWKLYALDFLRGSILFIGAITLGFGSSFYSGTVEALAYDTLLELDDTDSYKRISGNLAFTHFSTEAIMSVLGGVPCGV